MLEGAKKWAHSQIFMNLLPQMAKIRVDNQWAKFNPVPYGEPP